jgi:hypothetical protein
LSSNKPPLPTATATAYYYKDGKKSKAKLKFKIKMGFHEQAQVQDQEQMKGKVSHFKIPSTRLQPASWHRQANQQINLSPMPHSCLQINPPTPRLRRAGKHEYKNKPPLPTATATAYANSGCAYQNDMTVSHWGTIKF